MESLSTQVARIVYLSYNLILCTIFKKSEEASSASKTIVKGMWVQRHTWSNMYTEQHKHVLPCHFALQVLLKAFKDSELAQDFLVLQVTCWYFHCWPPGGYADAQVCWIPVNTKKRLFTLNPLTAKTILWQTTLASSSQLPLRRMNTGPTMYLQWPLHCITLHHSTPWKDLLTQREYRDPGPYRACYHSVLGSLCSEVILSTTGGLK